MFLACSYNFGKSQPQRSYKKGSYKKKKSVLHDRLIFGIPDAKVKELRLL